jgi:hypothetical protein
MQNAPNWQQSAFKLLNFTKKPAIAIFDKDLI